MPIQRVTVFGGARPRPGETAYDEAQQLGSMLAQAGYTVLTGGYAGTMEAVSRGAREAGAHVIGMTCDEIESWRQVGRNPWVVEEIRFPSIRQRLLAMIEGCDAALALPGGAGTLAEISMMWNHLITAAIPPKPLVLIGPEWKSAFDCYFSVLGDYTSQPDKNWLSFVPDNRAAIQFLDAHQQ